MEDKNLEYFVYLDKLRESGTINMMGAPRELQCNFGITKIEARKVFLLWTPRELQNEFGLNKVQARSVFQLWCLNLEGE